MSKYCKYKWNILAVMFLLVGCNDYLKEDSGDLLIPKKVDEFSPMLYAEGYPSGFNGEAAWFKLMTDDVEMGRLEIDSISTSLDKKDGNAFDALEGGEGYQAYVWGGRDMDNKLIDNFWGQRYENILACNLIIRNLPDMNYVEQDSGKYNYLAAQAYALRAYHYWCLINTYALPYAEENLDKPGVIIRTNPEIEIKSRPRSSIREVYRLINEDIEKAEQYIIKSDVLENKHLLTRPAVYLLASRIALFQEDWDEVIRVGKLFLEDNSSVFDLNTIDTTLLGTAAMNGFCMMDGMVNEEIVFTFGNSSYTYNYLATSMSGHYYGLGFRPSRESNTSLLKSYEKGDLRLLAYFKKDTPGKKAAWPWEEDEPIGYHFQYPIKYWRMNGEGAEKPNHKMFRENWRSVEVMLNLAEAYVRKTNTVHSEAVELLNTLRKCRISSDEYVEKKVADFNDSEDFLRFIWAERRRELCFEEAMRFWDLRRQGMPKIEHRWYTTWNTYETYILRPGSPNYVLAIPDSELNYNDACMDNSREIINAI